jgi:hypothetical protein
MPVWKKILQNFFYAFAIFTIVAFCLYILENSRIWKTAQTVETGTYSIPLQRTDKDKQTKIRYISNQEYYWLLFLELVTIIGLPTMLTIGLLLQVGLKITIIPREDDSYQKLE